MTDGRPPRKRSRPTRPMMSDLDEPTLPSAPAPPSDKGGPMYGERFARALAFSCRCHFGQRRKGNGAPYVTHPIAVASLVGEFGGDEDQAVAALLHDVLEDCDVELEQLAGDYGMRVAGIVSACTDTTQRPKPPWRQRKEAHLAHVKNQPPDVKLVLAADKLHNARSILADLGRQSVGLQVWDRFRATRPEVLWYYRAMVDALAAGWRHELLDELDRTVRAIEQAGP